MAAVAKVRENNYKIASVMYDYIKYEELGMITSVDDKNYSIHKLSFVLEHFKYN